MKEHLLYSSEVDEMLINDIKSEYPEYAGDDATLWDMAHDILGEYYEDLFINYAYTVPGDIVAIAGLDLWNGRRSGYKMMSNKLSNIFQAYGDYHRVEWRIDGRGNVRGSLAHHDGTNYIEYRMLRPDLSETQIDNFLDAVYNDEPCDLGRYTVRLGDYFGDIMGYRFPNRPKATLEPLERA